MFARTSQRFFTSATKSFKLPDLPYDFNALEPVISAEIMQLHHGKHHAAYVNNLNAAVEKYQNAEAKNDVATMISLQSAIKFNGGGHVNHSIFWKNLAPQSQGGGEAPTGDLAVAINSQWGSLNSFITKFNEKTAAVQGSGWGWLGYNKETGKLEISTQPNQDPLSVTGLVPLLGIDVWEHAYYLQYKNARPDYLKKIWEVVNWKDVARRFQEAK
eukprot:GILJ01000886.1.p1 GENE.GILJ01000886.1~~GILJ01000886.1.p1  ORF type:complete len:228 (+),score=40.82 GILJ01000886.1:42-686(+)